MNAALPASPHSGRTSAQSRLRRRTSPASDAPRRGQRSKRLNRPASRQPLLNLGELVCMRIR